MRPKAHVFWGAPFDFFLMGCSHTLWFAWNFGDEMCFAFIVYKLSTRQGSTRKHDRKGDSTTLWWEAFLIEPGKCWSWDDLKENLCGNLFLRSEMAVSYIFPEINPVISSTNRWWSPENTSTEIRRNLLAKMEMLAISSWNISIWSLGHMVYHLVI